MDRALANARQRCVMPGGLVGSAMFGSAVQTYGQMILATSGLLAYWPMNDASGNIVDSVSGNNGVAAGSPTYQATPLVTDGGKSIDFDGTDDRFLVGTVPAFAVAAFSIEAWVTIDAWNISRTIANNWTTGWAAGFALKIPDSSPDNRINFFVNTPAGGVDLFSSGWNLATTYHIVGTSDGNNTRLYRNGVEVASDLAKGSVVDTPADMRFGIGFMTGGADSFFWDGKIDNVAYYNRVLSAVEVLAHYNKGIA